MSWNQLKKELGNYTFSKEEISNEIATANQQLIVAAAAIVTNNALTKQVVALGDIENNVEMLVGSVLPNQLVIVSELMTGDYSADSLNIPIPEGFILKALSAITELETLSCTFEYAGVALTETLEMSEGKISCVEFNSSAGYAKSGDLSLFVSDNESPGFRVGVVCALSPFVVAPQISSLETTATDIVTVAFTKSMKNPTYNEGDILLYVNGELAEFVFEYDEEEENKINLTVIEDIVFGDEITITILENKFYSTEHLYFAGCTNEVVTNNVEE